MQDVAICHRHHPGLDRGPRSRRWGQALVIAVAALEVGASTGLPTRAHRAAPAQLWNASGGGGAALGAALGPLSAGQVMPVVRPSPGVAQAAGDRTAEAADGPRRPSPADKPADKPAPAASAPENTARSSRTQGSRGQRALAWALAQIGKPYAWGAQGPDAFDCSGLTAMAWLAAGVDIARTSQDQWRTLPRVHEASLRPGDLVLFYNASHVGLYAGAGMVVQAPRAGRRVSLAKMAAMPVLGVVRPG